MTKRARCRVSM
uniref:Uncharacterized protein n=1 Tax=Arundo donax TaxID=35708 RepID=A0A0A8YIT6_ARUDO